jgi:hypothetical protein
MLAGSDVTCKSCPFGGRDATRDNRRNKRLEGKETQVSRALREEDVV